MDGLEWKRAKWSAPVQRVVLRERVAAPGGSRRARRRPSRRSRELLAAAPGHRADHDESRTAPTPSRDPIRAALAPLGLTPRRFGLVIARPEPENSILEIVTAWSRAARRHAAGGARRVRLRPPSVPPARARGGQRRRCASPGAIYDRDGRARPARARAALPARAHGRRHQPVAGRGARRGQPDARARQRVQPVGRRRAARATSATWTTARRRSRACWAQTRRGPPCRRPRVRGTPTPSTGRSC